MNAREALESPGDVLGTSIAKSTAMVDCTPSLATGSALLAVYANYCEIGHNAFEFLLDFGQFRPETGNVQVHSRIVAGPVQAKLFSRLFAQAVDRFEASHGPIPDIADDDALAALLLSIPDFERRAMQVRARPLPAGLDTPVSDPPVQR